ncbi:MAG TPA: ThuA domain-containing protein [Tepidisphaeraceae bacterium]|jgi:predicted dehydrogenase/type 1 glutamine amidotransferase
MSNPIRTLVLTGGQIAAHQYSLASKLIEGALAAAGMGVTATHDPAAAGNLASFDSVVLFTDGDFFTDPQIDALIRFVRGGGGLVSLHTAAKTNERRDDFAQLIGARVRGGVLCAHKATVVAADHPVMHRVQDYRLDDEIHVLEKTADSTTLVDAWLNGRREPLALAKHEGSGRTLHIATGHSLAGLGHPTTLKIITRGVRWTGGEDWSNKTIKCGCIGYGGAYNMGKTHLQSCARARLTPVAVCDLDPKRTATARDELGQHIQTYNNVNGILDSDAELLIVIVPHNLHASLSVQCLQAGKHVVTEKPYTITVEEATNVIETARAANKMATVFHNRRWDGDFVAIKEIVDSGVIGDVFHIECAFGGYEEPRADWWRASKDISGGAFYDWGAHFVDWVLQLMPHKIESISGDFKKLKWHGVTIEDYTSAYVRFEGQRSASIEQGAINAIGKSNWRILGTLGGIEKRGWDWEKKDGLRVVSYGSGRKVESVVPYYKDDWDGFYRNVADHLLLGEPLAVTPESARKVIAVLSLAERSSAAGGAPMKLDFEQ